MKLTEYLKEKEFAQGKKAKSFPKGETPINLKKAEVEEIEFQDPSGKSKTRWILKNGEDEYWAGIQIMRGIKEAIDEGANEAKVVRSGEGINTQYIVLAVEVAK